jgi:ethanolamine utilization protein EutN
MRIAEVIGRVTLNKCHPSLTGATWRLAVALDHRGLKGKASGRGEPFVIYDELGSSEGHQVGVSEGAEASAPFYPDQKPIDGYVAAILDQVELSE